jgi:C4-dicarboxylate transporter DctM subunit
MQALALLVAPLFLLAGSLPIFLVLMFAAVAGIILRGDVAPDAVHTAMFGGLDTFALLAVPLFILAGDLMARGGIARRIIEFALAVIGGVRGSLALATIASASVFGAISGSSVACVAAIGQLTLPSLEKKGYGRTFGVSLITATGVIDVIIPPSIPMIIYGIVAQVPVVKLFLAGIVPGLLIALCLAVYVMVRARIQMIPLESPARWRNIWLTFKDAFWALMAPVVILGGIYGGAFTPTEAAGVACIYAILVSVYAYRELTWLQVWHVLKGSTKLIAQIMIIVSAASAYAWLITTSGIADAMVNYIKAMDLSAPMLLLVLNVLLLCVGSILEPPAAILVLAPLLTPLIAAAGIDPLHFGLVVTVNLAIGLFMPPFGLNLFASHALFGTPLPALYRGVLPFLGIYMMMLVLLTYVPAITLWPLKILSP